MAETTFTAIPYEQLSDSSKSIMEFNAVSYGMTPEEYYESRGGVNKAGYYGDSYVEGRTLTDAEYFAVIEAAKAAGSTGTKIGQAINLASAKKYYDSLIAQGVSPERASNQAGYDPKTGNVFEGSTGSTLSGYRGSTTGTSATGQYGPGSAGYEDRKSAYDLLFSQFQQYGLGALVEPLKNLITEGISPSEFTIRLRETDAYKKRFAANAQRIQKGLRALSEAEYIGLEDQYQDVMRRYGLPESYYTRGDMGRQEGFEKFIGGDVSPVELEDRIQTAQNRVINAAPEVSRALREFYPDITNGDILAYALDPSKAIENIKRKVTAAEIGAGAMQAGLATGLTRAEELRSYGVTGEQARQGYQTIGSLLPRATTLADIYSKQGMGAYTQTTAEAEVFGTPGAIEAEKKRRQLAQLETASFSGSSGAAGGALARERAGQF